MSQKQSPKPKIHFFAGNPNVEITHGIIHLFRNLDDDSNNDNISLSSSNNNNNNNASSDKLEQTQDSLPVK
jgi:hypothetical protein